MALTKPRKSALFGWLMAALALLLALGVYFLISGLRLGDAPFVALLAVAA